MNALVETREQSNIMVVDGSALYRALIPRVLRTEMHNPNITACATAKQALNGLESANYSLITTPLMLPDMDGLEFCRRIHQSNRNRFTPIIVVSGDDNNRLLQEGFGAGVTDYFDKSWGYEEFVEFIKAFTQRNLDLTGKVLYVEDSPTQAMIAGGMMRRHGLQVIHVSSAEEAMELLHHAALEDRKFDLVVTDFFLEGKMTGGDLLHAIRVKYRYSQQELPVLVITIDNNQNKQVDIFRAGGNDFVAKPIVEEIFMARIRSLLTLKQQLVALLRQTEEMKRLAPTDALTGLHSKRYLLNNGGRFIIDPCNQPVWAIMADVDHFEDINDKLGHINGDRVLAALGKLLSTHFAKEAMAVRFGGEKFAVLLPNCPRLMAEDQTESLRRAAEELRPLGIPITISLGIASPLDHPGVNLNQLLGLADNALFAAKKADRNCAFVFATEGPRRLGSSASIESLL
ncbi:MAG: response regulator [Gammaproteobacteria bacterium]